MFSYVCINEIVQEYFLIIIALLAHHGGTDLAKAYTVAPSCTFKDEAGWLAVVVAFFLDNECRAVEVGRRERTTNLKFLADGQLRFSADNSQ